MALAPLALPLYPDVPDAQGVPPVLRAIQSTINDVVLLATDIARLGALAAPWGIYDQDGAPVALADSVVSLGYRREYRVPDYPIEQGAFANYNKVQRPFDSRVALAKGGTEAERTAFLTAIGGACASLDLFAIVTPSFVYPSANVVAYDYQREARNGATLLIVEVTLVEIRVTGTTQFSQTAAPDGARTIDNGTVQAQAPSASQVAGLLGHA